MRTVYGDHARFEMTYFSMFDGYYFTGDGEYVPLIRPKSTDFVYDVIIHSLMLTLFFAYRHCLYLADILCACRLPPRRGWVLLDHGTHR